MNTQKGFAGIYALFLVIFGLAVIGGGAYVATHKEIIPDVVPLPYATTTPASTVGSENITTHDTYFQVGSAGYYLKTKPKNTPTEIASFSPHAGYVHDGTKVYFGNVLVPSADLQNFVVLGSGYEVDIHGKDVNHAYFKGKSIPNADPDTFIVLGLGLYAKDKNAVYYTDSGLDSAEVVVGADPLTASAKEFTLTDKNGPYRETQLILPIHYPTADVSLSQNGMYLSRDSGTAPLSVTFSNFARGCANEEYLYFGDGPDSMASNGLNGWPAAGVKHTYTSAGTYTVEFYCMSTPFTLEKQVAITVH